MLDGSLQKDVAHELGVCGETYLGWEHDRSKPSVRYIPKIIGFLGCDPFPKARTLGERIAGKRRGLGLSQERLAALLGVDKGTLRRWERGEWTPTPPSRRIIDDFLAAPLDTFFATG